MHKTDIVFADMPVVTSELMMDLQLLSEIKLDHTVVSINAKDTCKDIVDKICEENKLVFRTVRVEIDDVEVELCTRLSELYITPDSVISVKTNRIGLAICELDREDVEVNVKGFELMLSSGNAEMLEHFTEIPDFISNHGHAAIICMVRNFENDESNAWCYDTVKKIVMSKYVNINNIYDNITPLSCAVSCGWVRIIPYMLDIGYVNLSGSLGRESSAIVCALNNLSYDIIDMILEKDPRQLTNTTKVHYLLDDEEDFYGTNVEYYSVIDEFVHQSSKSECDLITVMEIILTRCNLPDQDLIKLHKCVDDYGLRNKESYRRMIELLDNRS